MLLPSALQHALVHRLIEFYSPYCKRELPYSALHQPAPPVLETRTPVSQSPSHVRFPCNLLPTHTRTTSRDPPDCKKFAPVWEDLTEMNEHLQDSSEFYMARVDCIAQGGEFSFAS